MASRYSIILPFILATFLVSGTVELCYSLLGKVFTKSEETLHTNVKQAAIPVAPTTAQRQISRSTSLESEDYAIISKRNLFGSLSDTPSNLQAVQDPILATTSLKLILLGTVEGMPDDQRAIIRNKKSKKQALYAKGDTIENALIKEIKRGKIILTVNGKDEILLMEEIKSPPSTGSRKNFPMPGAYTPPKRSKNRAAVEAGANTEQDEQLTSPTNPKRRLSLTPRNQQVAEP